MTKEAWQNMRGPLYLLIRDSGQQAFKSYHIGWSLFNSQEGKTNTATCEEGPEILAYGGESEAQRRAVTGEG